MAFDRKRADKERTEKIRKYRNSFKSGKSCVNCGSDEDLQFHHKDPKTKSKDITKMKNFDTIRKEVKKTVILCKKCHERTFMRKNRLVIDF